MDHKYRDQVIEPIGYIFAAATFLFSLILFYVNTGMFFGSLFGALISSGLAWASYIMLRWVLLAFRE